MIEEKENRQILKDVVGDIKMSGFCVAKDVIPKEKIKVIREEVLKVSKKAFTEVEKEKSKTRAQGHKISIKGEHQAKGLINNTQVFAPYLAHEKILGTAEALLGPYARIVFTSVLIKDPGTERFYWHDAWPYNQSNAMHINAPYPDVMMGMTTIWMMTPFNNKTGGTYFIPGSHRVGNGPSVEGAKGIDIHAPYKTEVQISGDPGDVLLFDPRVWHAGGVNYSDEPRIALIIRYVPWWFNLNPARIGSSDHTRMIVETNGKNFDSPPVKREVYENLPDDIKPLFHHWVGD